MGPLLKQALLTTESFLRSLESLSNCLLMTLVIVCVSKLLLILPLHGFHVDPAVSLFTSLKASGAISSFNPFYCVKLFIT